MFEILLAEWHLDPLYITENWTEELLDLMTEKLIDRKAREAGRVNEKRSPKDKHMVPDTEMFRLIGAKVREEPHGN